MIKHTLALTILLTTILFTSCKEGDPGPAGKDGNNGLPGAPGSNGADGTDGENFEQEGFNVGSITLFLDGKRPDGISFQDTLKFRYAPSGFSERFERNNTLDNYSYFVGRFDEMNTYPKDAYVSMSVSLMPVDNSLDTLYEFDFHLHVSPSFPDHKYFTIDDEYYYSKGFPYNVSNPTFTSFSYDNSTRELNYKFQFVVPAVNNATGYDLKIAGITNAILDDFIFTTNGRMKQEGITIPDHALASQKAVMKSLPY